VRPPFTDVMCAFTLVSIGLLVLERVKFG